MIELELKYEIVKNRLGIRVFIYFPAIGIGSKNYFYDEDRKLKESIDRVFVLMSVFYEDDFSSQYKVKDLRSKLRNGYGPLGESIKIINAEKIINELCDALGIELKEDFATGGLVNGGFYIPTGGEYVVPMKSKGTPPYENDWKN